MSAEFQRLIDKDQIRDAMLRYCRGVDRRQWDLVRDAFFEDATDHHADFKGAIPDFISWIEPQHAQVAKSSHVLGNILIEFASDSVAVVESYFVVNLELGPEASGHRRQFVDDGSKDAPGRVKLDVHGRYVDRFEKRDGEWRVAKRQTVFDSQHSRPLLGNVDENTQWALGRRDAEDAVFQARRDAGL
ncbi:MAG: nuclear transport factor 2 family protein [Amaricoccus sp.]|uniref:nuclear transport factor 2 family protein n=1 Tax=Amaricoccus sp. TaxID=1872485 RepID=UPI0039E3696B